MTLGIRFLSAAMVLAALALSACEGGSGSTDSLAPFLGHWTGAFVSTPVNSTHAQNGTMDFTVQTNKSFMGTMANTDTGVTGTIGGELTLDGGRAYVHGTLSTPDAASNILAGTLRIEGGHLVGELATYTTQRILVSRATVDLRRP